MKSLFIVFEGIDGSGTSTQVELLKDFFTKNSHKAVTTAEPTNGPIGHLIKEALKKRIHISDDKKVFDKQMSYLFAADRYYHLYNDENGVFQYLKDNTTVISTRYFFSSLVYNCEKEDFDFVKLLNSRFPDPDILIYIDNPVEMSVKRISTRKVIDVYENSQKLTHVKQNYENLLKNYKGSLLKVDGSDSIENIHNKITVYIEEKFPVADKISTENL